MQSGQRWLSVKLSFNISKICCQWKVNSLQPDGTKSLPEPMLISHQWGSMAFTRDFTSSISFPACDLWHSWYVPICWSHHDCCRFPGAKYAQAPSVAGLNIRLLKFLPHLLGTNELRFHTVVLVPIEIKGLELYIFFQRPEKVLTFLQCTLPGALCDNDMDIPC